MQALIHVVDDDSTIRRVLEHLLSAKLGHVVRSFESAEACLKSDEEPDLTIVDIMMPGMSGLDLIRTLRERLPNLPIIVLSSQGSIDVAVEALKLGAVDYFGKNIDFPRLEASVRNALEKRALVREVEMLRESVRASGSFDNIITTDAAMDEVLRLVRKSKDVDITVLIQGESGTGKELIARAIHYNGRRVGGPFIAVNCAAIPRELLESEMFGHEKGAFTGALDRKIGRFEQASGGTLFLDEIGEMEVNLQAKLLRAIQSRQIERVGGSETIAVDVRLVSATNKDLLKESAEGRFREDLYYRLATFPIVLPPLRRRRSDIPLLADSFLRRFSAQHGSAAKRFSRKALDTICAYPWPGNVRELESAIERAVLLSDGATIVDDDLPVALQAFAAGANGPVINQGSPFDNTDEIIPMETLRELAVRQALKITSGNVLEAARRLGISRSTMYEIMKRLRQD